MKKDVLILTGAGQIGMAIARRIGHGKKIVIGDKNIENAEIVSKIMTESGYDVEIFECDISSRESILNLIYEAQKFGEIAYFVNAAGVSPSQAPIEAILKVDLYGTAVLLEDNFALTGFFVPSAATPFTVTVAFSPALIELGLIDTSSECIVALLWTLHSDFTPYFFCLPDCFLAETPGG